MSLRAFEDGDYARLSEVRAAVQPRSAATVELLRHADSVPEPHVRLLRLTADVEDAGAVGFGRIMHIWWNYHPRQFQLRIDVDPRWQQRGIGSAVMDELMRELRTWDAALVRADAGKEAPHSQRFLAHRGFVEWRKRWELILDVTHADVTALQSADSRLNRAGIGITTYADESHRRGDERLKRELYELENLISRDEPGMDQSGGGMAFERFCWTQLEAPDALPAAHFLACLGERLVGVSRVARDLRHSDVARQGFTGVHPELRGRGIAQALKLRTVAFARQHGYRHIVTSNDATNGPMVHVNERIGFRREREVVLYERCLDD